MTDESSRFNSDRRGREEASWADEDDWKAGTGGNVDVVGGSLVPQASLTTGEIPNGAVARWLMNGGSGDIIDQFNDFDLTRNGALNIICKIDIFGFDSGV
jgi:hypothetical protein